MPAKGAKAKIASQENSRNAEIAKAEYYISCIIIPVNLLYRVSLYRESRHLGCGFAGNFEFWREIKV